MDQQPLFERHSDWKPTTELPSFVDAPYIVCDVETCDPDLNVRGPGWDTGNGYVCGYGFSAPGHAGAYAPTRHRGGGNLDEKAVKRWVRDLLQSGKPIVMFNALYDFGWLAHEGFQIKGPLIDPMFAAALLDEHRFSYGLDVLCKDNGIEGKDDTHLRQVVGDMGLGDDYGPHLHKLHSKHVGPYGTQDCVATADLWEKLKPKIEEEELEDILRLECDNIPLLVGMRRRGIRVDEERAEQERTRIEELCGTLQKDIDQMAGFHLNVSSNPKMKRAAEKLRIPHRGSFDKEWRSRNWDHPFVQKVHELKKQRQVISLVIDGMIRQFAVDGRIHCELHPLRRQSDEKGGRKGGTVTGRFSSSKPNLQQVTKRDDELGPICRGFFLPDEGHVWVSADYSQQEYRTLVHLAVIHKAPGWERALAYYEEDPDASYHKYAQGELKRYIPDISYGDAKNMNFGIVYTMGAPGLARRTGMRVADAEVLLNGYHRAMPFVKKLTRMAGDQALKLGWVRTLAGRRAHFNMWEPKGYQQGPPLTREAAEERYPGRKLQRAFAHKALNKVIQGTGADMIKMAMRLINESTAYGETMNLQVHDELNFSVPEDEAKPHMEMVSRLMNAALPLTVPMKTDIEAGPNWSMKGAA